MAHFAKIEDNEVVQVVVVADKDCGGGVFPESEPIGQNFIASIGLTGKWIQTSYNNNFRKQYAGIGYAYDVNADVFVSPQPAPSWHLDENHDWQPPVPKPEGLHYWDEDSLSWKEVNIEA